MAEPPALRYRSVFISDVHLGARGCQAELLLDFIRNIDCEALYLVGDIVDGWRLKGSWYWPQAHNDVVQKILRMARRGVRVTYLPGNHDEFARGFCGVHFGGVVVAREAVHEAADGKRYLVVHGDAFDGVVNRPKWLAKLGDWSYRALLHLNTAWNRMRGRLGLGYWSFAAFLKSRVKKATRFIDEFEAALAGEARRRGLDGVICGHIHKAQSRIIGGVAYINDGDWVESCTAAVELADGRIKVVQWGRQRLSPTTEQRSEITLADCAPAPLHA